MVIADGLNQPTTTATHAAALQTTTHGAHFHVNNAWI